MAAGYRRPQPSQRRDEHLLYFEPDRDLPQAPVHRHHHPERGSARDPPRCSSTVTNSLRNQMDKVHVHY